MKTNALAGSVKQSGGRCDVPTAQGHLRKRDAARQEAILNAIPLHIALLDGAGRILWVNAAWKQFASENAKGDAGPDDNIGSNYLEVCDLACGADADGARQAAAGIRAVLAGTSDEFTLEYPCHSPDQKRWFVLTVARVNDGPSGGVVVMHLNHSAEQQARDDLRTSEQRFRQISESLSEVAFLSDAVSHRLLYVSPAYEQTWGYSCASLYADPSSWSDSLHPEDRAAALAAYKEGIRRGPFELEFRIRRTDGKTRWILSRIVPLRDEAGSVFRIAGVATDVTDKKLAELDFRESERRFMEMLDNVNLLSVMLDCDARITYCNEFLLQLTGWRLDEVLGRNWFEVFMPVDRGDMRPLFRALLENSPTAWHREQELVTRTGEARLVRWNNTVLRAASGAVIGAASIGEDITGRRDADLRIALLSRVSAVLSSINKLIVRATSRVELYEESCRIAVNIGGLRMALIGELNASTGIVTVVAAEGVDDDLLSAVQDLMASPRSVRDRGTMTAQAMATKRPVVANDSKSDSRVVLGSHYVTRGVHSMAVLPLMVDGEVLGVLGLYAAEPDFFGADELALLTDLADQIGFATGHIDKLDRLVYLAHYDPLTGMANRVLFQQRLQASAVIAEAQGRALSVVVLDIERFRSISDTLGRAAGDALLAEVAKRMTKHGVDSLRMGRFEANRFAVMVHDVSSDEVLERLLEQRIAQVFGPPFLVGGTELRISARFGLATRPLGGTDAEALIRNAEAALQEAQGRGERHLIYTGAMNLQVVRKLTLENQLRLALENQEFVLHYQPKWLLGTGRLCGVEALIRWNDPRTGLVAPAQFIPVLEETGLILDVGRWALRQAIDDYARWRQAGLSPVRIAVNVSPMQLRSRGFIDDIRLGLGTDPHAAAGLELELTESLIMESVEHSVCALRAIRGLGVGVAIDDFGTGFSSLSYLARLPVDTLKIDRSFITAMTAGPEGLSLVSTIINLAHSMKLRVVAEGVETEDQSRLLRLLGCDEGQGYLFSVPLPGKDFECRFLAAPGRLA